jgi:hypothetical protein
MVGQRGTALLMTMILITVIGSIAFGVGRTTLSNLRQVNRLEDSLNAYQAAQAGIEDALMRFRFDKNAEAPKENTCFAPLSSNPVPTATVTPKNIFSRVDISNPISNACADLSGTLISTPPSADIVYDLKMYYRKDKGQHECLAVSPTATDIANGCIPMLANQPALARDTSVEYNVRSAGVAQLRFSAQFVITKPDGSSDDPLTAAQRKIQISSIDKFGNVVDEQLLDEGTHSAGQVSSTPISLTGVENIRIRPFAKDLSRYELIPSGQGTLDSRITTIESIGYYGVSKRKLSLKLDRLTGTIFEVFDFVLFSGNGEIKGPSTP